MKPAVLAAVVALALCACGSSGAQGAARPCTGSQLRATFRVVPGSAGAGNIVYALVVSLRSGSACTMRGMPAVKLLSKAGKPLPTHAIPARRGQRARTVAVTRHASARASARFSPDVPGVGETTQGRCEPIAYRLRVSAPGGGAVVASISPPTPVCEHGQLQLSVYATG